MWYWYDIFASDAAIELCFSYFRVNQNCSTTAKNCADTKLRRNEAILFNRHLRVCSTSSTNRHVATKSDSYYNECVSVALVSDNGILFETEFIHWNKYQMHSRTRGTAIESCSLADANWRYNLYLQCDYANVGSARVPPRESMIAQCAMLWLARRNRAQWYVAGGGCRCCCCCCRRLFDTRILALACGLWIAFISYRPLHTTSYAQKLIPNAFSFWYKSN